MDSLIWQQIWRLLLFHWGAMAMRTFPNKVRQILQQLGKDASHLAKAQGFRLEAADLADWLVQYSPRAAKGLLSGAVNLTRPFTRGLGLWVSEFSDEQIEITIPDQERLRGAGGETHEALVYAVASEALQLMWQKEVAGTQARVHSYEVEILAPLKGSLRCRFELPEMERQLYVMKASQGEVGIEATAVMPVLGSGDRRVAQVNIRYQLHQPQVKRLRGELDAK